MAPRPSLERKLLWLPLQAQLPPRAAPGSALPPRLGQSKRGGARLLSRRHRGAATGDPETRPFPSPSARDRLPDGGRFLLSRLTARVNIAAGAQRTEQPGSSAAEPEEGKEEEEEEPARRRPSRPRPSPPLCRAPLSLPTRARGQLGPAPSYPRRAGRGGPG